MFNATFNNISLTESIFDSLHPYRTREKGSCLYGVLQGGTMEDEEWMSNNYFFRRWYLE